MKSLNRITLLMLFLVSIALVACGSENSTDDWDESPPSIINIPEVVIPDDTMEDEALVDFPSREPTALSIAADQLKPGQSVLLQTQNLSNIINSMGSALAWGQTGVWDSNIGRATWIGKSANTKQFRRLEYDETTNSWAENDSLHQDLIDAEYGHGYDGNALDPTTGDLYFRTRQSQVYHLNFDSGEWTKLPFPRTSDWQDPIEWWPGRGLVYSDRYGVMLWDGLRWSKLVSDSSVDNESYHSIGEYQRNADIYVFGGGNANEGKRLWKLELDNTLTQLPNSPVSLGVGIQPTEKAQGIIVQDPSSKNFIISSRDFLTWYELNPEEGVYTQLSRNLGNGSMASFGTPAINSPDTVAIPIPEYGVVMYVSGVPWNDGLTQVWLYKHASSQQKLITTFDLTSGTSGEVPFTVGLGFKKGDIANTLTLDLESYQVEVKRRWPDGSVKHAIVSGYYSAVAEAPTTIEVYDGGCLQGTTSMTEADISAEAPEVTVDLGRYGSANLGALLGSPSLVWLAGSEMVEAHYHCLLSAAPHIVVKFHVRLYRNKELFFRVIVENGSIDHATSDDIAYVPNVNINGSVVYDNGGSVLTHYKHTRWDITGWSGMDDPNTNISHNTAYLMASRLVPNYWKMSPSQTSLDALSQEYLPLMNGDITANMPGTGYQPQIGLLPLWDALYLNSFGASEAFNSLIVNARSINSYPIYWPDPMTNNPIVISDWPTATVYGANGGGATNWGAGNLIWDIAHHGSAGYLAYLITGDYYFLETMQYQATLCYLFTHSHFGSSFNRLIQPVQTRGIAWATRTYGQLAGIAPLDPLTNDIIAMLDHSATYWRSVIEQPEINKLGYIYIYEDYSGYDGRGVAPWQLHFWMQSNGYVSDLEYSGDMTDFDFVKNHMYKGIAGILGQNGEDHYCYTHAGKYTIAVSDTHGSDPVDWFDSWGEVWEATFGTSNTDCGTVISGYVGESAKTTYLGNLLPALAYAIEDSAPGAVEGLQRLQSADNWPGIEAGGWEDVPIWGIMPRGM